MNWYAFHLFCNKPFIIIFASLHRHLTLSMSFKHTWPPPNNPTIIGILNMFAYWSHVEGWSLCSSQVIHPARAYYSFPCSITNPPWIGYKSITKLPTSISSAYPDSLPVPIQLLGREQHCDRGVFCPRT